MGDLAGKAAIVTGGSRGIGRAIALKLASEGTDVAVCSRTSGAAEVVAAEIEELGVRALAQRTDVSDSGQAEALVKAVQQIFGRLDILVNNAGVTRDGLLMRMKEDDWDLVLNTNLRAAFLCTRAVLRYMMKQRWGRIINITSVAGIMGNPGQANYASAKSGLIGLTKTIAREVASRGITANAIAPGFIDTDMTRNLGDEPRGELMKQVPLGSIGTGEDVAQAVAFLASDEAGYITGQVLTVDGGTLNNAYRIYRDET